jgi:hypothetical protein
MLLTFPQGDWRPDWTRYHPKYREKQVFRAFFKSAKNLPEAHAGFLAQEGEDDDRYYGIDCIGISFFSPLPPGEGRIIDGAKNSLPLDGRGSRWGC